MIVIRLSKKNNKNFFYINVIFKKRSVKGKIIKRIGFYDPLINFGKKYFLNYNLFFKYIIKGAKMSKRLFEILKL